MRVLRLLTALYAIHGLLSPRLPEPLPRHPKPDFLPTLGTPVSAVHLSAGNMAGTTATPHPGTVFFQQRFIKKSRIWLSSSRFSQADPYVHHLSFPDANCTNFSTYSRDETGREFLLDLASTFRPVAPPELESSCS